jgi:hypothetical protein
MAAAAAGDADGARAALATADRAVRAPQVDAIAQAERPAVELADLDRWHGRTLVTLGDRAAVEPLERALAAPPRSARHRAAVHADLALALATEQADAAATHARTARELAEQIGSDRIRARLTALATPG